MPPDEEEEIGLAALTEALFRPEVDGGEEPVEAPTDLEGVGPATATVMERAPFEPADVAAKRVSYRDLIDAGFDPPVAERLRRAHSLVWSFEWAVGGGDLPERAEQVRGLGAAEREWIARSAPAANDPTPPSAATPPAASDGGAVGRESPPDRTDGPSPGRDDAPEREECERCGGSLSTYALGDRRAVQCEDCGYTDLSARRG